MTLKSFGYIWIFISILSFGHIGESAIKAELDVISHHRLDVIKVNNSGGDIPIQAPNEDSIRLAELDRYWVELSRTVREGDYDGYEAAYHDDAVVVFASGKNKVSLPIATALAGWKQGFLDTRSGKVKSDVQFRFSQRIGDKTTAHETGIFFYTSGNDQDNQMASYLTHFDMLLVKRNGIWYGLMEYQKSDATQEEWNALK